MPTVHLLIKGKVQGVFYRASAKEEAEKWGLMGWVRNTKEGDVEAVVTGSKKDLDGFVGWCRRGPSRARVEEVIVEEKEEESFEGFRIIK